MDNIRNTDHNPIDHRIKTYTIEVDSDGNQFCSPMCEQEIAGVCNQSRLMTDYKKPCPLFRIQMSEKETQ
jgi:hypothetical protein